MDKRIFIAIPLPLEVRRKIEGIQNTLKTFDWPVRWEQPEKLHITLRFVGQINTEQLPRIQEIVHIIAKQTQPFTIQLRNFILFPNLETPRVLSIMLKHSQVLQDCQQKIAYKLDTEHIGNEEKYPFSGHITICRLAPIPSNYRALTKIRFWSTFQAEHINVMQSVLKLHGSEYTVISSHSLGV
ncbi:MAG: RNA 2',3'-cyclic phosphodiesterase [Patescibacteria group bacterium]|nr:RNA 2',3'-cyclic phosphodiesterase [Patescibacteria group bacterium]